MTVQQAVVEIQRVGSLKVVAGTVHYEIRKRSSETTEALTTLKARKSEVLAILLNATHPGRELELNSPTSIQPLEQLPESLPEARGKRTVASGEPGTDQGEEWLTWAEWKARRLNRLFLEQGCTGKSGQITAATVRHGEIRWVPAHNLRRSTVDSLPTPERPMSRAEATAE